MRCLTAGLLISLAVVVSACGGTAPKSVMPAHLLPASMPSVDPAAAENVLLVRVYAGSAFRARVIGWERELEQVILAASSILQDACGARLELVESLDWKLAGGNLGNALQSLRSLDQGVDVNLMIGLIDAASDAEVDYAKLLDAQDFGKHIVIRSFHRTAESALLAPDTDSLDEATSEELLDRRRRHKQAMILAQAVAKLFGAPLAKSYQSGASKLDAASADVMRVTISATLMAAADDAQSKEIWEAAGEQLKTLGLGDALVQRARQQGLSGEAGQGKGEEELATLRGVDHEVLTKTKALLKDGAPAEAWAQLEPLTELYDKHWEIVSLACEVAFARGAADALDRCQRATGLRADDGQSWLRIGRLQLKTQDAAALQSLKRAGTGLADDARGWRTLARAYRKLSFPTLSLAAAQKAGNPKSLTKTVRWASESRTRYGSNVGVDADSEGRYLVAIQDALKLVYKNDYGAAKTAAADLRSSFPQSIAGDLVLCEIAVRRRKYPAAKLACQSVLKRQSGNAWSHYLLGVVSSRNKLQAEATEHWTKAVSLDPGLKAAYQALAKVYRKTSDPRLKALRIAYKDRFGSELK